MAGKRPDDDGRPVPVVDRVISPPEKLAELRDRGPVSSAIADLHEDPTLDAKALPVERGRVKAEALAEVAGAVVEDPARGPVGEMAVEVGKRTVVVSDVHVDGYGALVCTIDHPDIPAGANPFRFVNPPVSVYKGRTETKVVTEEGPDGAVEVEREVEVSDEDPEAAFREMVADVVTLVTK